MSSGKNLGNDAKPKKKGLSLRTTEAIYGYSFLSLWLIGFLAFTMFPFFYSIWLSVCDVVVSSTGIETTFVGIKWYREAFLIDALFVENLTETFSFVALLSPVVVIISMIIAILLNGKFKGRVLFRALFFFPVVIASGPVMEQLVNNQAANIITTENNQVFSVVNTLPAAIGGLFTFAFSHLVFILWFSGVQMLIFLASLQKISSNVYEASAIDGASKWQVFWKIVLPFLRPAILINVIYTVVELSAYSNTAVNIKIQGEMFSIGKVYSYSSALSWIYSIALLCFIGIIFLLLRERKE